MSATAKLLSVAINAEHDIVAARQRARQIADAAGFDRQDQVRIATAVSEIARNAFQYAGGGKVEFSIHADTSQAALEILVTDNGPGIPELSAVLANAYKSETGMGLGIIGARRLMDSFRIESGAGGTCVQLAKYLPSASGLTTPSGIAELAARVASTKPPGALHEIQHQNQELMQALADLRQHEADLRRLNQELEDTNRGVLALYAEIDDRAESLRLAGEIKSRFLSHMSHEFRTPLTSILALCRLLLSFADGELNSEQQKQIGYIRRAAEELSEMVNDLLDLAKVESGKITVHVSEFSVASLFGALRGMLRPLRTSSSVTLVIEDPDPGLTIRTDEAKVSQVLRNLVSNALKFTEAGEVRVRVIPGASDLTFAVSDTGIGIPAADHNRVFQEFAQVDNPIQRRVKGTGLGLPLSRKLAELLGGDITLESAVGTGSTFYFRLPPDVMVVSNAGGDLQPQISSTHDTLLVIDDDEISRYLLKQMFHGTAVSIVEAEDGTIGIERARFDKPAAIFLDLNMPGLSGFEVLEELKTEPETRGIPVIIFSSRHLSTAERGRLERHAAAVLSKHEVNRMRVFELLRQVTGWELAL